MAIEQPFHTTVVTVRFDDTTNAFGFPNPEDAVKFVSDQVTEEAEKIPAIRDAINKGYESEDGKTYQILDTESYLDIYVEIDDEDDE